MAYAPPQIFLFFLNGQLDRWNGTRGIGVKTPKFCMQPVTLRKAALKAVSLHPLHALAEHRRFEAHAACCGKNAVPAYDLRRQKRWLVERIIAVDVEAHDLDDDDICVSAQRACQVEIVDIVKTVRTSGRACCEQRAVHPDAEERRCSQPQACTALRQQGAKRQLTVHLPLASRRPHRKRFCKIDRSHMIQPLL